MKLKTIAKLAALPLILTLVGCSSRSGNPTAAEGYSSLTGWKYNDKDGTGFEVKQSYVAEQPLGMVAIEGGSFTMGEKGEFVTAPRNSRQRRITVSSFYMDQYEVRNVDWREYTNWMKVVFQKTAPRFIQKVQPDNKVWRDEMAYNEPYLKNYFIHPAFDEYPVVGVTWEQVMDYCGWRTDRVNEMALIKEGIIDAPDFFELEKQTNNDSVAQFFVFNTQKYLTQASYNPPVGRRPMKDIYGEDRKADMSDGILFPEYRLPTEAEWEFAAYAITSTTADGLVPEGKIYPWAGSQVRNPTKAQLGRMMANFVRGRGDMMGTSGNLNDNATLTAPVNSYMPNDFGLYNMAGNVNEWVLDVYRSTTFDNTAEYNSFRGNQFYTPIVTGLDSLGRNIYKIDSIGRIEMQIDPNDDFRGFKDGDATSQIITDFAQFGDTVGLGNLIDKSKVKLDPTDVLRPRITDKTRVYKGGSWKDRVYWLNPSTRRFLNQDKASNDIGFRCAMSMVGSLDRPKPVK